MSVEPRQSSELPGSAVPASAATSSLRVLLVVLPLLVIIAAATNLMGLWTTPYQQAAREERRTPEREAVDPADPARKDPELRGT